MLLRRIHKYKHTHTHTFLERYTQRIRFSILKLVGCHAVGTFLRKYLQLVSWVLYKYWIKKPTPRYKFYSLLDTIQDSFWLRLQYIVRIWKSNILQKKSRFNVSQFYHGSTLSWTLCFFTYKNQLSINLSVAFTISFWLWKARIVYGSGCVISILIPPS